MTVINIALIGCGDFVWHTHLANLTNHPRFRIYATVDIQAAAAQKAAEASGAAYWTDDVDRVMNDPKVEVVFIATPHDTHAALSIRAAQAGKHIFCEKPMALNEEDCRAVETAVHSSGVKYLAGYNRAVAPFTLRARELLNSLNAPVMIYHRFADWNPYGVGWLLDEKRSGGRLVGEAGHALDMMCRLAGQNPVRVYAEGGNFAAPSATNAPDSGLITLGFPNGSCGTLLMSSVGNNYFPKEEIQITCANQTIVIYGFERMVVSNPAGQETITLPAADKGLRGLLDQAARVFRDDASAPVGLPEALRASRITFAAVRSIRTRQLQQI